MEEQLTNSTNPLVDLEILQYYDTQIKSWVINRISNGTNSSIIFLDKDSFPSEGVINTMYINKDGLFLWDAIENKYINIANQGGEGTSEILQWGSF